MNDIVANHGIEIDIKQDGKLIWINVDRICRLRVTLNKGTIEINDSRIKSEIDKENSGQLTINFEKEIERGKPK